MKTVAILLTFFICQSAFTQKTINSKTYGQMEFFEFDYGLAKVVDGTSEKLEGTPTKTHGWLKDFEIIKVTDSIKIEPKANFGVVYGLRAKDSFDLNMDIEWVYPKTIKNDNGEKFKSIRYTTKRPTNTPSASSYSLDAPYEMVSGKWILNLYIDDRLIYTRSFYLYK